MTTAVIVQARMGSTRLPGKVLLPLAGHTVLEEVLRRCRAIPGADVVVCAIPEDQHDDVLVAPAERAGAVVVRGSATDVLARYALAAEAVGADTIMRVTSDCPLIDPTLCGEVLDLLATKRADYAANNMPPGFPHGLDCEACTAATLKRANEAATTAYEREHVTPWMRTHQSVQRASLRGPGGDLVDQRWTLDYVEDLVFLDRLFAIMPKAPAIRPWADVAAFAAAANLQDINAARRASR
ncbi:MAG: NTP transferase domain-containing protein [Blastochloris sp.]|nr:NTP transferase domain-containing protein [Blastochloris sp.]